MKNLPFVPRARAAYQQLPQREQILAVAAATALLVMPLTCAGWFMSRAISQQQHRLNVKTVQLAHVLSLQGPYKARERQRAEQLKVLAQAADFHLVGWVEQAAKDTGVDLSQLRPEEGEPDVNGVVESRVEMRASGLTADRVQDFLNRLEGGEPIVWVRRLKIDRPYRKDVADVEMTVSTLRLKK